MSRVVHTNIWSAYGYARKAGYEGTEEEFEQGLKKSAEAAGNAEESAYTASEAATEADAARDAAAQSAESASTSEGNALEYANSAAQVLRDAQAVAQTVNAKATEAAGSASRAENYAQTATTKASEAATAAGTATTAATSASGSAQAADASATAAAASETNAAASASSASTSAGSASESADDAAESAAAAQAVKDSIPADYSQLSADVTELKSQIDNNIFSKNLVGDEPDVLYPVRLKSGDKLTSYLSDFSAGTALFNLYTYNDQRQQTHYWTMFNSSTADRRTITIPDDVYYLAWHRISAFDSNVMVELGSEVTGYVPWFPSVKALQESLDTAIQVTNNRINNQIDETVLTANVVESGYYIATGGNAAVSVNHEICKYSVNSGDTLYLDVAFPYNTGGTVFQFQNNVTVPSSGNSYIIGDGYASEFAGEIRVPDGATWLMVVHKIGTADNIVKLLTPHDILNIKRDISDLSSRAKRIGKNLIGNESGVYYPVFLNAGDVLTISVDGDAPTSNRDIYMYNEAFERIEYWALRSGETKRTITIVHDGIRYLRFSYEFFVGKKLQIEYGADATEYEEYRNYVKSIKPLLGLSENLDYDYKLRNFKQISDQYKKGNLNRSWYDRIVLLHTSDNHIGTTFAQKNSVEVCTLANDVGVVCVVNSGDMTNAGSTSLTREDTNAQFDTFTNVFTNVLNSNIPIAATLGNHDANDISGSPIANIATKEDQWTHVFSPIAEKYPSIVWGNSQGFRHYNYIDIPNGNYTLRIISLDMLDHADYTAGDNTYECHHRCVYSQDQINWLCNTALNVGDNYGIIINNHFPFAPYRSAGYSEEWAALNDGTFVQGWTMIPEIVEAWQNRTAISKTFADSVLGVNNITVNADFASIPTSARFVCFLTGHTHSKNAYSVGEEGGRTFNQLMLCEDSSGQQGNVLNRSYKYDDGIQNTAASQVAVDMQERTIYRTAYGVYQHCSRLPESHTEKFEF